MHKNVLSDLEGKGTEQSVEKYVQKGWKDKQVFTAFTVKP